MKNDSSEMSLIIGGLAMILTYINTLQNTIEQDVKTHNSESRGSKEFWVGCKNKILFMQVSMLAPFLLCVSLLISIGENFLCHFSFTFVEFIFGIAVALLSISIIGFVYYELSRSKRILVIINDKLKSFS